MRRYDGNSGRYIHVPEEGNRSHHTRPPRQQEQPKPNEDERQKAMPPPNRVGSGMQNILSNLFAQGFEVEDLLLFAVLFLMYQETKDKELLIIMGGMFLL